MCWGCTHLGFWCPGGSDVISHLGLLSHLALAADKVLGVLAGDASAAIVLGIQVALTISKQFVLPESRESGRARTRCLNTA